MTPPLDRLSPSTADRKAASSPSRPITTGQRSDRSSSPPAPAPIAPNLRWPVPPDHLTEEQPVDDLEPIRLAELVAALSLGIDLGFGQPMEHVVRQCWIALRLAEHL